MNSTSSAAHPGVAHRGLITVSIMLATIMQALDTTIANVALPHMQGSFKPPRIRSPGCSRPSSWPRRSRCR